MQLNWFQRIWNGSNRHLVRGATVAAGCLILLFAINVSPRVLLWIPGMQAFESAHFVVWAQNEDRREAIWLRTMLEDQGSAAAEFLDIKLSTGSQEQVYLYPDQASFQIHGAGIAVLLQQKAWYTVDHAGHSLLVTSPHQAGPFIASRPLLQAACGEYVRSLLDRLSGHLPPWLAEGLVMELGSGSIADENLAEAVPVPEELMDQSVSGFELGNGPRFADSFVAWIELRYGKPALLQLLRSGGDYQKVLGADPSKLFVPWMQWLVDGKPGDPRRSGRINVLPNAP